MNNKKRVQLVTKFYGKFFISCLQCNNDLGYTAVILEKGVVTINCSGCHNTYILFPLDESQTQLKKDPIRVKSGEVILEEFRMLGKN